MSDNGHWRKLSPTHKGKDRYGAPVLGKTWVKRKKSAPKKDTFQFQIIPIKKTSPKQDKALKSYEKDLELFKKWKESGSEEDLVILMDRFQGSITRTVQKFKDAPVPNSVIEAAANVKLLEALNTYDPSNKSGANLNTWVTYRLKKVGTVVGKYQNIGKIPEHRRLNIAPYKEALEVLEARLGHPPSAKVLSEYLGWSMAEVTRMENELSRKDLIASQSFEPDSLSEMKKEEAIEKNLFRNVYYALDDEKERLVFEYTAGFNGKEELSAGEIAKKLKIHPSKVSRIRKKIDKMFRERGI